jgi:hypothetical protein
MADPITGLPPVRTDAQLGQQATSQVDTEIQGQVSPLQSLIGSLQQRQKDAVGEVGNMFSTIQPYVAGSAQRWRINTPLLTEHQQASSQDTVSSFRICASRAQLKRKHSPSRWVDLYRWVNSRPLWTQASISSSPPRQERCSTGLPTPRSVARRQRHLLGESSPAADRADLSHEGRLRGAD